MHMAGWLEIIGILIAVAIVLLLIVRFLALPKDGRWVGIFTMVVGAIGIAMHLRVASAEPSVFLLPGAIVFGCGAIATAVGTKKE